MKFQLTIFLVILILIDVIYAKRINYGEKVKTKRGIYSGQHYGQNYGQHYGQHFGSVYEVPAPATGLAYGFARDNQWQYPSIYSKIPGFFKSGAQPYAFAHGGATVQSHNVNYPRFPFVQQKALIPQPQVVVPQQPAVVRVQVPQYNPDFVPIQTIQQYHPIAAPAVAPTIPTITQFPSFLIPQKPIIPIAVPTIPTNALRPASAPKPTLAVTPVFSYSPIQPQFVPIPFPTQPVNTITTGTSTSSFEPTVSTSSSVQPTGVQPTEEASPGTTFVSSVNPDQSSSSTPWRPMTMTTINPTQASSPDIPRPPISLLPPYMRPSTTYDLNFLANSQSSQLEDFGRSNQGME